MEDYELCRLKVLLDNAICYILKDLKGKGETVSEAYSDMKHYLGTSMYELHKLGVCKECEVDKYDKETKT